MQMFKCRWFGSVTTVMGAHANHTKKGNLFIILLKSFILGYKCSLKPIPPTFAIISQLVPHLLLPNIQSYIFFSLKSCSVSSFLFSMQFTLEHFVLCMPHYIKMSISIIRQCFIYNLPDVHSRVFMISMYLTISIVLFGNHVKTKK